MLAPAAARARARAPQAFRMDPVSKEWKEIGTGAVRIVRGAASARLVFSLPVPEKRRERQAVNARVDANTKPVLLPAKDGKLASVKVNLLVAGAAAGGGGGGDAPAARLVSYIFKVKTDAQAQAIIDSVVRVTASLSATAASAATAASS